MYLEIHWDSGQDGGIRKRCLPSPMTSLKLQIVQNDQSGEPSED